ncbi:hypothetical protein MMPV_001902 [Pyropia vietnamensis]
MAPPPSVGMAFLTDAVNEMSSGGVGGRDTEDGVQVLHVERAVWREAAAVGADGPVDPDLAAYRDNYLAATAATAAVRAAEAADAQASALRAAVTRLAVASGLMRGPSPPNVPCFATDQAAAAAGRLRPLNIAGRQASGGSNVVRQQVTGSASTFDMFLDAQIPPAEAEAIIAAARLWAAVWPSEVPVRTSIRWADDLSSESLGAAFAPLFFPGGAEGTRDDMQYGAPMFMSLTGKDMLPENQSHVEILLNRRVRWHAGTSRAPRDHFDLTTVTAHEIGHGLFFTGRIGFRQKNSQRLSVGGGDPARFDSFIADMDGNGVVASCRAGQSVDSQGLHNAVTAQGLSFVVDESANGGGAGAGGPPRLALPLFAPRDYRPGSSVYHFDGGGDQLRRGCAASGIPNDQCSSLMVAELPSGKTERTLGGNTIAVMRAMRDGARQGLPGGTCSVSPNAPGSSGDGGIDGFPGEDGSGSGLRFSIPTWAVITLGVAAAVSVVLFVAALLTNVVLPAIHRRGERGGRAGRGTPQRGGAGRHGAPPQLEAQGAAPAMGMPTAPPPVANEGGGGVWPPPPPLAATAGGGG